ncbi:MAG: hypothetical protein UY82_C0056G0007 [Candidatus Uhrbacteria bacterium GW2011_GWC2_53_7]|uniref:Uncharacterized protein n=1 Tax=Candidatus Uhrbacteria bacterium GW2011_GWC2_53_7 TaxID=1618986 RepID=A0A0G2AQ79_9BACT|nr:MAG: hypothetical protein UY82_C0056G0007 [Candidatus Uhrbacteria bacterium GW2011_GWC2_53_7]
MATVPVEFGLLAGLVMLAYVFDSHDWNIDRMIGVVVGFVARPLIMEREEPSAWMWVLAAGCAAIVVVRVVRRFVARMKTRKQAYWNSIE